jgi:putative nucleotidyltransferase with HDIG domain/PAS domain S-box-containing protein
MIQTTPEGSLVYANPACAQLFGCTSAAEMIDLVNSAEPGAALYADPGARRQVLQDVHEAGGEWIAVKTRLRHMDGDLHTDIVYLCEGRDPVNGGVRLYGFIRDVTAEEEAEKLLQHSAYMLGQGESLAHLGSWEWDVQARMSTVSKEWQRIHGLAGDHVSDDEILAVCFEEDRGKLQRAFEEAAGGSLYHVDHRIVHPATREVRHLMTYGEPIRDAEGCVRTVVGASLDVTERVRADEVLREREERLRRALAETVSALGATVAMRDPYTADHARRVASLAARIAKRLGWSEQFVERVRTAALVHDVGKIIVPAEILSKPGRLADLEFELIKAHSAAGHELLATIEFDGPVAEIVLQHHERLDGSGYPRGLRGEEILPGARVLAVADVVEAMTAHRPYRAALSLDEAIAEIEGGLGRRYDAEVGAACLEMLREPGFTLLAD